MAEQSHPLARIFKAAAKIEPYEVRAVMIAFVYGFFLLGSYFILRPVRDAMGTIYGTQNLQNLWLVTFIDSFVHNCYFNWTGTFLGTSVQEGGVGIAGNWIMPVMSVGQIAEILTMLVLGVTLKNLGWRATMISRRTTTPGR